MAPSRDAGPETPPLRVFLVDDHEVVRRGVKDVLELSGGIVCVGAESSAERAPASILRARPDVALIDLRLDDGSGIEVARAVSASDAGIGTVILTAHEEAVALTAAVLAGAWGYVLKLVRASKLVETVREVGAGRRTIQTAEVARVVADLQHRQGALGGRERLGPQDTRVLSLMGSGSTNSAIAAELDLPIRLVEDAVSRILFATEMISRPRTAATDAWHDLPGLR